MHLAEHVLLWWPMEENSCTVVATMKLVLGKTPKKRGTALLDRFIALDIHTCWPQFTVAIDYFLLLKSNIVPSEGAAHYMMPRSW